MKKMFVKFMKLNSSRNSWPLRSTLLNWSHWSLKKTGSLPIDATSKGHPVSRSSKDFSRTFIGAVFTPSR